jgi:hypothetical protein
MIMRKEPIQDKMASGQEIIKLPQHCPYCGRDTAKVPCRSTPNGWFCWQSGLHLSRELMDGSLLRSPEETLRKDAIEQDSEVRAAVAELERAEAESARCWAEYEAAVGARFVAEVNFAGSPTRGRLSNAQSDSNVRRLQERQTEADHRQQAAGQVAMRARESLAAARQRAAARHTAGV